MSKINETNYPRRTQANYEDTDMFVIQKAGGNTYTTRIEDLREDCQKTLAPALNTMRENLATIEGSTASKAYAKGDYLVFGGRLCKAKTSIAVNATLILDTNIELAPVGDELSSISSDLASVSNRLVSMTNNFNALNINDYTAGGTRDIFTSILEGVIKPNIDKIDTRNLNVSFYVSSNSSKPNDLPANTLTWNYAYGKIIWRVMNVNYVGDGCIILFGFGSGMAIKYFTNNNLGNWNYVTMTT